MSIIYVSIGGMSKFVSQMPRMDVIFTYHCMVGQLSTMSGSVLYKNKSRMGDMTLRRILIIPFDVF